MLQTLALLLARPKITLVSVAIGRGYVARLDLLERGAVLLGFDRTLLWRDADVSASVQAIAETAAKLSEYNKRAPKPRPFCAAFKPLIMLRAFEESREGDWVLWADSSAYTNASLAAMLKPAAQPPAVDAHAAVAALQAAGLDDGAFGVMACPHFCARKLCMPNGANRMMQPATLEAYSARIDDSASFMHEPHVLNSNILLRVSASNRQLLRDWLGMAVQSPRGFCSSHPQDQSALTILTRAQGLPLLLGCENGSPPDEIWVAKGWSCHRDQKMLTAFLRVIQRRQFSVYSAAQRRSLNCTTARTPNSTRPTSVPWKPRPWKGVK